VLAALLALTASFTWGSSNYIAGVESRRRSVWQVTALSQLAAMIVAAVALAVTRHAPPGPTDTLILLLAGVATTVGIVAFYRALAIGTMSVVSPIVAANVLIPVTYGLLTGERPGPAAYAGMVCTIAGVVLVAWARRDARGHAHRAAILLAVLATVCWGFMLLALGTSGKGHPYWAVFDVRITSVCVVLVFMLVTRRGVKVRGQNLPAMVAIGGLLTVANILFTLATGFGYLSVVAILGSLSPVMVTGYAHALLGERLAAHQWAGYLAVFAGIVLLSVRF
jgi:drug/metabolite transporter (DMT)-like permease